MENKMKKANLIAKELGFNVKNSYEHTSYYYLEDDNNNTKTNSNGEALIVQISYCEGSNANLWHKMGYTKVLLPNWWFARCYVTNKDNLCYEAYNPCVKLSDDNKRFVVNFDWTLEANENNFRKLLIEILKRFNHED